MEMRYRRADKSCSIALENNSKPAMLQALHPPGESEFHLKIKTGGHIKIFTSFLSEETQYRNMVISDETNSDDVIALLLSFFNMNDPIEEFSIYQVCPNQEYQRKLHPDDLPLRVQHIRNSKGESCHFLVRKVHQRPMSLDATSFNLAMNSNQTKDVQEVCSKFPPTYKSTIWTTPVETPMYSSSLSILKSKFNKLESCLSKLSLRSQQNMTEISKKRLDLNYNTINTNENQNDVKRNSQKIQDHISYNPVYCVREIKLKEFENSFL